MSELSGALLIVLGRVGESGGKGEREEEREGEGEGEGRKGDKRRMVKRRICRISTDFVPQNYR